MIKLKRIVYILVLKKVQRRAVETINNGLPQFVFIIFIILFITTPIVGLSYNNNLYSVLKKSNLSKNYKEAITSEFDKAVNNNIPADLLLPRIKEGIFKKADGKTILKVLKNDISYLEKARSILLSIKEGKKILKDKASWARTANLISIGVSEDEIITIVKASKKRWKDYRSATYLYVSLVKWKLSKEESLMLTKAVLKSRLKGEDFKGIVRVLIEGRRLHIAPDKLVKNIEINLPKIENLNELRERVLYLE